MKYNTKENKGISTLAICISLAVMLIIAIASLSMVIDEDGILNNSQLSKTENIKKTAREQVELACATMKIVISEARTNDNSYSARANASLIQKNLLLLLNQDKMSLAGEFSNDGNEAVNNEKFFTITYKGDDFSNHKIVYKLGVTLKSIELVDEDVKKLPAQKGEKEENNNNIDNETLQKYRDLNKKIIMIALIASLLILIIIVFVVMSTLKKREINKEKLTDVNAIKFAARDKLKAACEAVKISKIKKDNLSELEILMLIQNKLLEKLNTTSRLDGIFRIDNDTEDSDIDVINVIYEGDDYRLASNDEQAKITYVVDIKPNGFHIIKEDSAILGIDLTD